MASSRFRNPSAMRSIVDGLNRSVLYSSATQSRSPSLAVIIVRSKSAVCLSSAIDSSVEPVQVQPRAANAQRERGQALVIEALGFLMGEHHLEHRRPAGIGIPLKPTDEQTEGEVLMLQAVRRRSGARGPGTRRTSGSPRGRPSSAAC